MKGISNSTLIVIIMSVLSFVSCKKDLGEYVYLDTPNILHIDKDCKYIATIKELGLAMPVKAYTLREVDNDMLKKICPKCVSDTVYKKLKIIAQENKKIEDKKNRLRNLHKTLLSENYDITDDFDQFAKDMEDESVQRWAYDALIENGYTPGSFDEIRMELGLNVKKNSNLETKKCNKINDDYLRKAYQLIKDAYNDAPSYDVFRQNTEQRGDEYLRKAYQLITDAYDDAPQYNVFKRKVWNENAY